MINRDACSKTDKNQIALQTKTNIILLHGNRDTCMCLSELEYVILENFKYDLAKYMYITVQNNPIASRGIMNTSVSLAIFAIMLSSRE